MHKDDAHIHPLTASQELFWRGHQLAPDTPLYNMAWRFDFDLELDVETFNRAFNHVFAHNDILRTTFHKDGSGVFQQLSDKAHTLLPVIDMSQEADAEHKIADSLRYLTEAPFDLTHETTRSVLIKCGQNHWVWFLCQHHIICDAQSHAVLFNAVATIYQNMLENEAIEAPSFPSYFEAIAKFEPAPADKTHIEPIIAATPYSAPTRRNPASTRLDLTLSQGMVRDVINKAKQPDYRLFTPDLSILATFITNYCAFLFRVTGEETITIGMPVHNRLNPLDKKTIGLFVEVHPFSISLDKADTFLTLHAKVKAELGLFLRQAKPGQISAQNSAKICAVLNYIQAQFASFAGAAVKAQWLHSGAHDAGHGFRFHISDFIGNQDFSLALDINDDVLKMADGQDIAAHFKAIFSAFLAGDQTPISHIDLLSQNSQDDQNSQGATSICTTERADSTLSIIDLFERQSQATPETIAIEDKNRSWTYKDLALRSDLVAEHLTRHNIATGSAIGVHMRRSMECLATIIGILKAGNCFVPLASNIPPARTNLILRECNAQAVFVDDKSQTAFPCATLEFPPLSARREYGPRSVDLADTAYILFTSGSTGIPKGVAVSHREFSRYIQWANAEFSETPDDDYAFFSSISFDLTLTSMFTPLIGGGRVLVYPERGETDLAVLDVFEDDRADVVKLTPSHLALICKAAPKIERIKTLIMGGENLTRHLCMRARERLSPKLRIANEYGPTEAVVGAMVHWFDPEIDKASSVQIGQAADGMTIEIRDQGLNICPIGMMGQIVISGRLAEGYFGQPEMTKAQFPHDPLAPLDPLDPLNAEKRLYLTGDLGRITKEGVFEYLGRMDQQIKQGGVRLEPAEIEHALSHLNTVEGIYIRAAQRDQKPPSEIHHCIKCGIPETYPDIELAPSGTCSICEAFDQYKARTAAYFLEEHKLATRIKDAALTKKGQYDAIMLLSGGKDSTYAAYRLAELAGNVLALTLDNGFIAEGAKDNIDRVVNQLGWDHRYLRTDRMNEIFVDSLKTHANVCQGCFKAIYTLALRVAKDEGAPIIVTGLSRGQFYETRLTPDLFRVAAPSCEELDQLVDKARRRYHAEDDAISRLLNTDDIKNGDILDTVEFVDIYRYIDVPVSEIYHYLDSKGAWRRPSDTGRSTNCLINDVGIHVHKQRMGYHNYALPYSWDVRMGHKTRTQALDELHDEIDIDRVTTILSEIGFDEPIKPDQGMGLYVFGSGLTDAEIWAALRQHLPAEMMPKSLTIVPEMPLTPNGKIDEARLPKYKGHKAQSAEITPPETEIETELHDVLVQLLKIEAVSTTADFFDLGIDSLTAIEFAFAANEAGLDMPATAIFDHRNLKALAHFVENQAEKESASDNEDDDAPLLDLDDDDMANLLKALN